MYAKVTSSGGRRYLQLVEGYRTEDGKVRQRTIGTIGRIEDLQGGALDALINGLNRAVGRVDVHTAPSRLIVPCPMAMSSPSMRSGKISASTAH